MFPARLEALGVDIHCGTAVTAVGEDAQGAWAELEGKKLRSEVLVVGAGHRTLKLLGVERPWLFPLRGAALRYRGVDAWNPALAAVESYRGHLMFRPGNTPDEWLVGGLNPGASWEAHTAEQRVDEALSAMIHKLAVHLVPSLGDQHPQAAYPLIYTYTADGLPLVGPLPGSQRTWLLAGLASRSWTLGPALGEQVARALLQQPHDLLMSLPQLRPARWMR
jgi:glycine/D-amino acid oxidase-like deaminating enzyme